MGRLALFKLVPFHVFRIAVSNLAGTGRLRTET